MLCKSENMFEDSILGSPSKAVELVVQCSRLKAGTDSNQSLPVHNLLPPGWCSTLPCSITGSQDAEEMLDTGALLGPIPMQDTEEADLWHRESEWMNPSKCLSLSQNTLGTVLLQWHGDTGEGRMGPLG